MDVLKENEHYFTEIEDADSDSDVLGDGNNLNIIGSLYISPPISKIDKDEYINSGKETWVFTDDGEELLWSGFKMTEELEEIIDLFPGYRFDGRIAIIGDHPDKCLIIEVRNSNIKEKEVTFTLNFDNELVSEILETAEEDDLLGDIFEGWFNDYDSAHMILPPRSRKVGR